MIVFKVGVVATALPISFVTGPVDGEGRSVEFDSSVEAQRARSVEDIVRACMDKVAAAEDRQLYWCFGYVDVHTYSPILEPVYYSCC